jgi:hypothetical protein
MASDKEVIVVAAPKKASSAAARNARAKLTELKKKTNERMKNARNKNKDANMRAGIVAVSANGVLGLAHRYYAKQAGDAILKGRKTEALNGAERQAYAAARQAAGLPHVKMIGEPGTYAAVLLLAGLATGQRDITAAGVGLAGTAAYIGARGAMLIDKDAAKSSGNATLQTALAGENEDDDQNYLSGDDDDYDLSGDDDDYDLSGDDDDDDIIEGVIVGDDDDDEITAVLGALHDDELAAVAAGDAALIDELSSGY